MIVLIYAVIWTIVFIQARKKFGYPFNIVTLFTGIWSIFGALSTFGIDHLRKPSILVHLYSWIFIILVDAVFLAFAHGRNKILKDDSYKWDVRHSYLSAVQILALLLYSPILLKSLNIFFRTFSLTAVRGEYFFGESVTSNLILGLLMRTAAPAMLDILTLSYLYLALNRNKPHYILMAVFNVCVLTFGNGGRYAIFLLLIASVILFFMKEKGAKKIENSKIKRRLKYGAIAAVIIMAIVTALRGQSLMASTISYFSGSFSFLDYILENPIQFDLDDKLFGYLTFGPFTEPMVFLLKYLRVTTAKIPSYYFNIVCQTFYNIGSDGFTRMFNNNTTVLYYYLRDFGPIGVVIGGILMGIVTTWSYNRMQKKGTPRNTLLFLYFSVALLETVMTNRLFGNGVFFSIGSIILCTMHKSKVLKFKLCRRKN